MKKNGLLNALGVLVYIVIVSTIMRNGDKIFGEMDNFIGPIAFLLLFTLSATVVGGLVLGKPLMLYLDGKKKEAVKFFGQTVGWIAGFAVITLLVAAIIR